MKYSILKTPRSANGTSYQGKIRTTYRQLLEAFGEPLEGSADFKTDCEWVVEFEDGTIATIYNWKTGRIPFEPYDWHIGGRSLFAVENISKIFPDCSITKFDPH